MAWSARARPRRGLLGPGAVLVPAALSLALAGLLSGCGQGPISAPDTGVGCSVTVQIPAYGDQLLGRVRVRAQGEVHLVNRNFGTVAVPCGLQAHLSAQAAQPSRHPFTGWRLGRARLSAPSLSVTVDGALVFKPQFRVPRVAPSPKPTPSASPAASPSPTSGTVTLDRWVSYDSATRTLTWKLVAGYQGRNHGLNFDGDSSGAMLVTVPVGWTVVVDFSNVASINHSAAVVAPSGTTAAFPGAEIPNPTAGTPPGQTASFTFTASQVGSYRVTCLVPGHEQAGMWDSFDVSSGGSPTARA
ncbi:MAG: sulfocyanin-like copper-binding protein [Candidatus Dormibacteria bacterium]